MQAFRRHGAVLLASLFLLFAFLDPAPPAFAQLPGLPASDGAGETAAPPPPSDEEIRGLISTLEDEAKRAELIGNLRLLLDAAPRQEQPPPVEALGARVLGYLSDRLGSLGDQFGAIFAAFSATPQIIGWFERQATDADSRDRWTLVFFNMGLVLVLGIVARGLIRATVAKPRRAIEDRRAAGFFGRLVLLFVRLILELVPLLGFVLAAYLALGLTDPERSVRLVTLSIVNAALAIGVVTALGRLTLAPHAPGLRLFRLDDETAAYLYVWVRRLVFTGVIGFFIVEVGLALGLPFLIRDFLLDLVALAIALMLLVLILQNRQNVRDAVRGPDGGSAVGMLRRRLADIWHVLAILYVAGLWLVFALGVRGGFSFVLRATVLSIVIIVVARLVTRGMRSAIWRGFSVPDDLRARLPMLEARANRYLPVLDRVVKAVVAIATILALLQVWGLGGFEWLTTGLGRQIVASAVSIAIVLLIAVVLWEIAASLIERHLNQTDDGGVPIEQSARMRTLLPLLRTTLMVVMIVVVGLIVLSEIGVNIAPLLAGAGVIGLAIGFGSQALVRDIITGLFNLIEDNISVGDVVEVGGHSGFVESISIRTIRLRDMAGSVHVVPFGEVTTVVNMTKDFSFYVFDVRLAYREDTDQVIEVLKQLGAELQDDPEYAPVILEPIEIIGVDSLMESAVIVKARFKTKPIKQWMVGREFNRRLKKRFDELGIEIPFPHTRIYFGADKDGSAPPAHVALDAPPLSIRPEGTPDRPGDDKTPGVPGPEKERA